MSLVSEKPIPFDTFKSIILEKVQEQLGPEREVSTNRVLKNNGIYLEGIMVKNTVSGISPTFYLETLYDMYKDGMTMDQISAYIMPYYEREYSNDFFGSNLFSTFDEVKNNIYIKLINTSRNKQLLKDCPSVPFLDLSEVLYLTMTDGNGSTGSVTVNNNLLDTWGVDFETVFEFAKKNTHENLGVEINNIGSFIYDLLSGEICGKLLDEEKEMAELVKENPDYPMFVMTNCNRYLGASSLMFDDVRDFADSIGSDLYIIPSSIHETILIPVSEKIEREELKEVLNTVNTTELSSSEYLSENVYYYSRNSREICI